MAPEQVRLLMEGVSQGLVPLQELRATRQAKVIVVHHLQIGRILIKVEQEMVVQFRQTEAHTHGQILQVNKVGQVIGRERIKTEVQEVLTIQIRVAGHPRIGILTYIKCLATLKEEMLITVTVIEDRLPSFQRDQVTTIKEG